MRRIAIAIVALSAAAALVGCAARPAHQAVRPAQVAAVVTATAGVTSAPRTVVPTAVAPTTVSLAGAVSAAAAAAADVGTLQSQNAQAGQDLTSSEGDPGQ
jgi:hypothetical protein